MNKLFRFNFTKETLVAIGAGLCMVALSGLMLLFSGAITKSLTLKSEDIPDFKF